MLFHTVAMPFYIPTSNHGGFSMLSGYIMLSEINTDFCFSDSVLLCVWVGLELTM